MKNNFKGKNFLTLLDFSPEEIQHLLDFSISLKKEKRAGVRPKRLDGKNIALIFEKASTRTRCAFTVACIDEGAHPEYLGKGDIQLGKKESVKDTARVLGRMFEGIQFRGFLHSTVEELAQFAGVPVWNGLTDKFHPTQILADFMTIIENKGRLKGIKFAYLGDGRNNVANSLMVGSAKMGLDCRIVAPKALFPDRELYERVQRIAGENGAKITVTDDVAQGVKGIDVIYTDVWASMGEEDKIPERINILKPYQINSAMLKLTGNDDTMFLHCLPCFHNLETEMARKFPDICEATEDVFEGKNSKVFDQSENRMHTIKAVMLATICGL